MMKYFLYVLIFSFFILGCSQKTQESISQKLILSDSIFDFQGDRFFGFIKEMRIDQSELYLLEEKGKVHIIDSLFQYQYAIGNYGVGPDEIQQGTNLFVFGDSVLVKDSRLSKMMIYNKRGDVLGSMRMPFFGWSKFLADEEGVFVENKIEIDLPLLKLSYELDTLMVFGQKSKPWNPDKSHHLHFFRDAIIAVPRVNEFNLQVYSKSGELIKVIDLEKMSPFADLFNFEQIEKKSLASNGLVGQIIATDVAVSDHHIYFLFLSITKNEKRLPVYMVKMALSEDWNINSLNTIELREAGRGPFHNFTVDKKGRNFYFFDPENGGVFHYISEN